MLRAGSLTVVGEGAERSRAEAVGGGQKHLQSQGYGYSTEQVCNAEDNSNSDILI